MKIQRLAPVLTTLKPSNHPYLNGAWTPLHEEVDASDLDVTHGAIPADIDGVYLRNTENQVHQPLGRFHPFDGDGMIHQIEFQSGRASYRNRFVRTRCFAAEQEAKGSLWGGLADPAHLALRPGFGAHGALKDSSSTDVVVHAGQALSTFYQCGEGYRLDPLTLNQLGVEAWTPIDGISAHPKVDEATGELLFFNYSKHAPYLHLGEVGADNQLIRYTPVPLPGPRLPHDMAFTENYSILFDLPMFWEPSALALGKYVTRFHPELPLRIAVFPRHGRTEDIRWFEAESTYVLHWVNAYEEGDEIVLDGFFEGDPQPLDTGGTKWEKLFRFLALDRLQARLHRWRFNLVTGAVREEQLSESITEFGTINPDYAAGSYRYAYAATGKPGWFLFDGLVKHDLLTGGQDGFAFGDGVYGSETAMAPRVGATGEDDGYLVTLTTDMNTDASYCVIFDAARLADGPVCKLQLPERISSGTHSTWAPGAHLRRWDTADSPANAVGL